MSSEHGNRLRDLVARYIITVWNCCKYLWEIFIVFVQCKAPICIWTGWQEEWVLWISRNNCWKMIGTYCGGVQLCSFKKKLSWFVLQVTLLSITTMLLVVQHLNLEIWQTPLRLQSMATELITRPVPVHLPAKPRYPGGKSICSQRRP